MMNPELHPQRAEPAFFLPRPRRSSAGLLVSLIVHLAIIALIAGGLLGGREVLRGLGTGVGPGPAGGGGGGGGSRVAYIELPSLGASAPKAAEVTSQPAVVPPPPVETAPEPTPVPPPVVPPAAQLASASGVAAAPTKGDGKGIGSGTDDGTDGGSGGGTGGGIGPGSGAGVGPGTGGDSSSVTPPTLRYWVPPTERAPKALRGRPIAVTFWVKADGSVERFSTDPEIDDQKYRAQFADLAMKMRFRPARTRAGLAVPAVVTMQFTLTTE